MVCRFRRVMFHKPSQGLVIIVHGEEYENLHVSFVNEQIKLKEWSLAGLVGAGCGPLHPTSEVP